MSSLFSSPSSHTQSDDCSCEAAVQLAMATTMIVKSLRSGTIHRDVQGPNITGGSGTAAFCPTLLISRGNGLPQLLDFRAGCKFVLRGFCCYAMGLAGQIGGRSRIRSNEMS